MLEAVYSSDAKKAHEGNVGSLERKEPVGRAEESVLGAEQLQQSLTITVSVGCNGTAGHRGARRKPSYSWYHKIRLVVPEMTKQYARPT